MTWIAPPRFPGGIAEGLHRQVDALAAIQIAAHARQALLGLRLRLSGRIAFALDGAQRLARLGQFRFQRFDLLLVSTAKHRSLLVRRP
jgi:hypothetical protein